MARQSRFSQGEWSSVAAGTTESHRIICFKCTYLKSESKIDSESYRESCNSLRNDGNNCLAANGCKLICKLTYHLTPGILQSCHSDSLPARAGSPLGAGTSPLPCDAMRCFQFSSFTRAGVQELRQLRQLRSNLQSTARLAAASGKLQRPKHCSRRKHLAEQNWASGHVSPATCSCNGT